MLWFQKVVGINNLGVTAKKSGQTKKPHRNRRSPNGGAATPNTVDNRKKTCHENWELGAHRIRGGRGQLGVNLHRSRYQVQRDDITTIPVGTHAKDGTAGKSYRQNKGLLRLGRHKFSQNRRIYSTTKADLKGPTNRSPARIMKGPAQASLKNSSLTGVACEKNSREDTIYCRQKPTQRRCKKPRYRVNSMALP